MASAEKSVVIRVICISLTPKLVNLTLSPANSASRVWFKSFTLSPPFYCWLPFVWIAVIASKSTPDSILAAHLLHNHSIFSRSQLEGYFKKCKSFLATASLIFNEEQSVVRFYLICFCFLSRKDYHLVIIDSFVQLFISCPFLNSTLKTHKGGKWAILFNSLYHVPGKVPEIGFYCWMKEWAYEWMRTIDQSMKQEGVPCKPHLAHATKISTTPWINVLAEEPHWICLWNCFLLCPDGKIEEFSRIVSSCWASGATQESLQSGIIK